MSIDKISLFAGKYNFLSNDHICLVYHDGYLFNSVTHAFQAARAQNQETKERISKIHDFDIMYEIAETIEDPANWAKFRSKTMEVLIRDKFRRNPQLRQRLSETAPAIIQNTYDDTENRNNLYWGIVDGRGENVIGKILMKIRDDIKNDVELDKWVLMSLNLQTEKNELPKIILHEYRNDRKVGRIFLEDKPYYTIGYALDCDLKFSHDSIENYHSILANDKELGVVLIDLNTKNGTFVKGNRLKKSIATPLEEDDIISFGEKNENFKVEIYVEHLRREYERELNEVDRELKILDMMQNPQANPEEVKQLLGIGKVSKIKVENISRKACNEDDIKELFKSLGEITSVYVPRKRYEAYVKFASYEAAAAAVGWNGINFHGRRLTITYDKSRKRSRSRSNS